MKFFLLLAIVTFLLIWGCFRTFSCDEKIMLSSGGKTFVLGLLGECYLISQDGFKKAEQGKGLFIFKVFQTPFLLQIRPFYASRLREAILPDVDLDKLQEAKKIFQLHQLRQKQLESSGSIRQLKNLLFKVRQFEDKSNLDQKLRDKIVDLRNSLKQELRILIQRSQRIKEVENSTKAFLRTSSRGKTLLSIENLRQGFVEHNKQLDPEKLQVVSSILKMLKDAI